MVVIAACSSSGSSEGCTKNSECPENAPLCNLETGKCEAYTTEITDDANDNDDKTDSDSTVTDENTSDIEANDTEPADTEPTDVADDLCSEVGTTRIGSEPCGSTGQGKLYQECGEDRIWHYTDKCSDNSDEEEKPDTDPSEPTTDDDIECQNSSDCSAAFPVCNKETHLCEEYSNCTIQSSDPCYTVCSEGNDEYLAWLNGTLVNKKCRNNTCTMSGKKVGVEPDTCEQYTTPPESCNPETSATLCSPNGGSVWKCDSDSFEYYADSCEAGDHCVQCQNRAGCIPNENCTKDSAMSCNSVCNAEGDGFYIWDDNSEALKFHICTKNDCIHICGTAQCKLGTGYSTGDTCEENSFKYCTTDGAFAFTCKEGHIVQKTCKNNDCIYDAEKNEITSCTAE